MSPIDRLREQALRRRGPQTLPPPMPPVPTDAAFYADLPDLLQAQIFVALQTYNRKRTPQMPEERLLWAGTPHTRVRTMLLIFVVWVFIMFLPAFYPELADWFPPPELAIVAPVAGGLGFLSVLLAVSASLETAGSRAKQE